MATYTDAFTDTNSTTLSAHTPTGGGFTWTRWDAVSVDYIDIQSNQANTTGSTAGSAYYTNITPSDADYTVQVTIGASASASISLLGRINTGSVNFVSFAWDGSAWALSEVIGGTPNSRDTDTSLSPSSTARTIKLVLNGTNAKGFVDGTEVCSGTLTTVTAAGVPGISGQPSLNRTADNWSFDDAIASNTTVTPGSGALALAGSAPNLTLYVPLFTALDEEAASDTDYVYATAASATLKLKLGSVTDPNSSTGHILRYKVPTVTGGASVVLKLYQDTTLIATDTARTAAGTYEMTLTSGQADSITDYSALYAQLESGTA